MDPLFLIGGALALLAISKSTQTEGGLSDDEQLLLATPPRNMVNSVMPTMVHVAESGNSLPSVDLVGVTSYANYRYVINALNALGYNTAVIDNAAINACVYRVSVYIWYYAFKAIANDDETLMLTDSGAYAVIDEWIKTFGYNNIGSTGRSLERNRFAKYSPSLGQDFYLNGTKDGGGAAGGAATGEVSDYQWVVDLANIIIDAIGFLRENNWFGLFGDDADVVRLWLEEIGITTLDDLKTGATSQGEGDSYTITEPIHATHDYWTAAVWMHKYIVAHPDLLPDMWPIYKY